MSRTDLVPAEAARALASMDRARAEIADALAAKDAETLGNWRDIAAAAQHYAARREDAAAMAADAGEIKVRAEAALGKIDREANPPSRGRMAVPTTAIVETSTKTRAAWRKLGQLKPPDLDAVITQLREDDLRGVTTARAEVKARELLPKKRKRYRSQAERRIAAVRAYDADLKAIHTAVQRAAAELNNVIGDATYDRLNAWTATATMIRNEADGLRKVLREQMNNYAKEKAE